VMESGFLIDSVSGIGRNSLKWYSLLLSAGWTLVFVVLSFWGAADIQENTREMATAEARAHFFKDNAFRLWGTDHGRIYVPVSETTQPDPYLKHIPDRDLTTPSGVQLTLINPASMIRQMKEHYGDLYGVPGRVTSLNPLRPENRPDAWEKQALARFDQGKEEAFEFTEIDGEPYLRLMRPLKVHKGCLLCHPGQGWRVGGNGGAVGVALPMGGYLEMENASIQREIAAYACVWLLGLFGLLMGYRQLAARQQAQLMAVAALTDSEARKAAIVKSALDCIVSVDAQGRVLEFNPAAERTFGYRREQMVSRDMAELLIPEESRDAHWAGIQRQLDGKTATILGERIEVTALHAAGHTFPVELTVTRENVGGEPVFTAFLRDITAARAMEEQLSYQATHDALTGLINRREFERRMNRVMDEGGREHCVLYMDLDQFKLVNDTSGHAAGDELLRQLSQMLKHEVRLSDTLARLGGDEFGVLLKYCSLAVAEKIAEGVLKVVRKFQFFWSDRRYSVGISIGVVPITGQGESLAEVMSAADAACYAAKERGRNRVQVYAPDDLELARRREEMDWVERIHRGFEEERFLLYRQAIVALGEERKNALRRYEFLVRMQDTELLSPAVFLVPAERFGLMPSIDRWVVQAAFRWLASSPEELEDLDFATINLSGHSIGDERFSEFIGNSFETFGIPPEKICFEITETAAVSNLEVARRLMLEIKQLGCRFALDDFGSGMSSFGYLKNLPVDFLKIDGSFVREMLDDPINLAMVKSINDIAQVLGKQTIAEFVESDAIREQLASMGVDFVQGYAISRPEPLPDQH